MNSKQLGIFGERIASNYLIKKGYKILETNYSPHFLSGPKRGEIDVVAKKKGAVIFAEVKTQTKIWGERVSSISPEMKVDFRKQKKIIKMAESWLRENKMSLNSKWQIDIISIIIDLGSKKAKIRHFKNV